MNTHCRLRPRLTVELRNQIRGKLRIVFYNHTGQVSGAEKMLLLGLRHLPRPFFETTLVCPGDGPLGEQAVQLGVHVVPCRSIQARFTYNPLKLCRYTWSILCAVFDLRKKLRSLQSDIVHANTVRAGIVTMMATAWTDKKLVWHIHDILPRHPLTVAIRLLAYSSGRVHLVACSGAAAATLRPVLGRGSGPRIIYNGCELDPVSSDEDTRQRKRQELALSSSNFVIGSIGQLTPRKGVLELIRAFADVKKQLPEAVLLICGSAIFNRDELYVEELHRESAALGMTNAIRFLGHRADAPEIMRALDLYVLNSKEEPFSISLIEAMVMEVPIVATDSGGTAEMFHAGSEGEIVPVDDRKALTQAILKLASDTRLRERYRKAAGLAAVEKYSKDRYIADWCNCYRAIHAQPDRNPIRGVRIEPEFPSRVDPDFPPSTGGRE